MRILVVTPAKRGSRLGNRITAERWAGILTSLGHEVAVSESYSSGPFDLLIALHARKSSASVIQFRKSLPGVPVIVALTGTDLHHDLGKSGLVEQSLRHADRVVLLEPQGIKKLDRPTQEKSRVIFQSAKPVKNAPAKLKRCFEVSVLGHLRAVKDPFRTAMAVRLLPVDSRVQVVHFGAALTPGMERRAIRESQTNPRYRWHGSVSHGVAQRRLARSRLTVLSSKSEGGPAVIAEAVANGVPVLATRISTVIGMLGNDYTGLFAFGDTKQLAQLIHLAESDKRFYDRLVRSTVKLKPRFTPENESRSWKSLIKEIQRL